MANTAPLSDPASRTAWLGNAFGHRIGSTAKVKFLDSVRRRARTVSAGTEVAFEGDRLQSATWILKGWVALSKGLDDGRRHFVDIVVPVDLIVARAADGVTLPYGITALTDSVLASCSMAQLRRQRSEFPELSEIIDRLSAAAAVRQAERMLRLGQGNARERVAHALLEMFVRLEAVDLTDGQCFLLPITQREFGELTGLTSVHVCRTLRGLAHEGMIGHLEHGVRIKNIAELARAAKLDIHTFKQQILPAAI